jgi:hypothetical protein
LQGQAGKRQVLRAGQAQVTRPLRATHPV